MDSIKIEHKECNFIAHRGLSGVELENTIQSFTLAGQKSYFGIETDVHVTRDKKFVIFHDDNTNRLSKINKVIENSNFDELINIPLNDCNIKKNETYHMPSLDDYIKIVKKYSKIGVLELKNDMNKSDIESIIKVVKSFEWLNNMIFISFSKQNIIFLKEIDASLKCQLLVKKIDNSILEFLKKYDVGVDANYEFIDKKIVEAIHKIGKEVNCYTVNTVEDAKKLISYNVDYITTNILE